MTADKIENCAEKMRKTVLFLLLLLLELLLVHSQQQQQSNAVNYYFNLGGIIGSDNDNDRQCMTLAINRLNSTLTTQDTSYVRILAPNVFISQFSAVPSNLDANTAVSNAINLVLSTKTMAIAGPSVSTIADAVSQNVGNVYKVFSTFSTLAKQTSKNLNTKKNAK